MNLKASIAGIPKSVTMIAAAVIAVAANVTPLLPTLYTALKLDPHTVQVVGSVLALIMATCRTITTGSLADKAAPAVLPDPPVSVSTTQGK